MQADITDGNHDIMLFTDAGKVVRFQKPKYAVWVGKQWVYVALNYKMDQKVVSLIVSRMAIF